MGRGDDMGTTTLSSELVPIGAPSSHRWDLNVDNTPIDRVSKQS